jgi:hypothetical protein
MVFEDLGETAIAFPFSPSSKPSPFTAGSLINKLHTVFSGFPDYRKGGNNQKYVIEDAALSAFSVFFTQSPSFLDYQVRMQQVQGRNNAQSIFGVHPIPNANQIRNLLDPGPPERVFPFLAEIGDGLYQHGYLAPFRSVGGTLLVAMDGTDFFSSETISCPCCTPKNSRMVRPYTGTPR